MPDRSTGVDGAAVSGDVTVLSGSGSAPGRIRPTGGAGTGFIAGSGVGCGILTGGGGTVRACICGRICTGGAATTGACCCGRMVTGGGAMACRCGCGRNATGGASIGAGDAGPERKLTGGAGGPGIGGGPCRLPRTPPTNAFPMGPRTGTFSAAASAPAPSALPPRISEGASLSAPEASLSTPISINDSPEAAPVKGVARAAWAPMMPTSLRCAMAAAFVLAMRSACC